MVRRGGIRTLKEASSGTFHRALRRPYAKVLRLPIPPRARGTEQKYRPAWASNNCVPSQPSPPTASPQHTGRPETGKFDVFVGFSNRATEGVFCREVGNRSVSRQGE